MDSLHPPLRPLQIQNIH